jgi:hypothetical protein
MPRQQGIMSAYQLGAHTHQSLDQGGILNRYALAFANPDTVVNVLSNHDKALHDALAILHSSLGGKTANDHHPQSHTLASHSTKAHTELTGVTTDLHHAQNHEARHRSGGADPLNHDNLAGFVASEHKSLPNTIAQVLSDHNKANHDSLALSLGSLTMNLGCKVYRNTTQAIPTGTWTQIAFNTEVFDVGSDFGSSQYTAPSNGYYLLISHVAFMNITAGYELGLDIRVAGAVKSKSYREFGQYQTESSLMCVTFEYLTSGQAVTAYCYQSTGSDKSIFGTVNQTYFCAFKVGG